MRHLSHYLAGQNFIYRWRLGSDRNHISCKLTSQSSYFKRGLAVLNKKRFYVRIFDQQEHLKNISSMQITLDTRIILVTEIITVTVNLCWVG